MVRKTGDEHFRNDSETLPFSLLNFWQWSASDLASNALRGRLAEFIVAQALGITDGVRREWDAYDLQSNGGARIEVKSSAYIQTWKQKLPAKIVFRIAPTRAWDNETGVMAVDPCRNADLYVFAVLEHQDKDSLDPLNVAQWTFYGLPSEVLNCKVPAQKQIGLATLRRLGAVKCKFNELAGTVDRVHEASIKSRTSPRVQVPT